MVSQLTSPPSIPAMAPRKACLEPAGGLCPYRLKGRSWADAKPDLLAATLSTLEAYAPGITASILHAQVLTPEDLESVLGLPFGHVHHGDMALDQMFFRRPVAGYARYRSPIAGLYMCGASNHPGGGVTGVPGHNAAREILARPQAGLVEIARVLSRNRPSTLCPVTGTIRCAPRFPRETEDPMCSRIQDYWQLSENFGLADRKPMPRHWTNPALSSSSGWPR